MTTQGRTQMPEDLRDGLIMGPHGPLRDMGVYEERSAEASGPRAGEAAGGRAPSVQGSGAGLRVEAQTDDVVGALSPVWRTGTVVGLAGFVIGLLMIVGTSGLAAVVLWPLGALSVISGTSVLWATHQARRAARRMNVQVTRVHVAHTRW
ncbi:hypothetical protein [Actinomyces sp. W5033]|uniref:hypothetical protein n=1 Tax=Actinomyces sp. W5033 TaxID=3446479 RepID=UPI003EE2068F